MVDKDKLLEKHLTKIIAAGAIMTVIIIAYFLLGRSDYERKNETKAKNESDIRFDSLTAQVWRVFDSTDRFKNDWIILAKLKAAEDSDYGDIDINLDTHPKELANNGMQITTSKILIPSPENNATKDINHGLPLSFYYKFIFNAQELIITKNCVVK